jgi:hypothetical protein
MRDYRAATGAACVISDLDAEPEAADRIYIIMVGKLRA